MRNDESLKVVKKKYTECEHFVLEKDIFGYWKCIYCDAVVKLNKFKENGLQKIIQKERISQS